MCGNEDDREVAEAMVEQLGKIALAVGELKGIKEELRNNGVAFRAIHEQLSNFNKEIEIFNKNTDKRG